MKDSAPQELEVEIAGLGHGGEGWVRHPEGGYISVHHALPGDRLRLRVGPRRRGRSWGEIRAWLRRSPDHVDPQCPYYANCTGCALRHVSSEFERRWKLDSLRQILDRYGPSGEASASRTASSQGLVLDWIVPESRSGFRERGCFRVQVRGEAVELGLRSTALDPAIEDIRDCPAQSAAFRRILAPVCAVLERHLDWAHTVSAVEVRTGSAPGGEAGLVLVEGKDAPNPELCAALTEAASGTGSSLLWRGPTGDIECWHGRASVATRLQLGEAGDEVVVEVPATSWVHPNPEGAKGLADWVAAQLIDGQCDNLLDLCCGIGMLTFRLSPRFRQVVAVDRDFRALDALRRAAELAGLTRVEVRAGDAVTILRKLRSERRSIGPAFATINPMRKPLGERTLSHLAPLGVQRVVYLGPSPVSAAKDAAALAKMGYALRAGAGINLYPGTGQVMLGLVMEAEGQGTLSTQRRNGATAQSDKSYRE